MRVNRSLLKGAFTTVAVGAAFAAVAGEKAIKSGETLVFMGDSITQYGWERTHGYPHLVVKGLAANGIDVTKTSFDVGICGNTSADMIRRFDGDALSKKPDVVTINAGVNDVWFGKVNFEQYCANMKSMVEKTKAAGARPILLSPTTALGEADNPGIRKFSAAVKELAAAEKIPYAETFESIRAWIDDPDTPALTLANNNPLRATYDGVHQVPAGDRQLARAALKAFGLDADELSKAEAAWNADETLVPLIAPPSSSSKITVKLTAAEAASVAGLSLRDILARGIPSLAADPVRETEAPGAGTEMTVTPRTGNFSYKAYDQLLLAARQLGIPVSEAIACAILRGVRNAKPVAPSAPVAVVNDVLCGATVATFDVTVKSVGATASACDVLLRYGTDAKKLGAPKRIAVGENGSFHAYLKGLKPATAYSYELKFVNNASEAKQVVLKGKFRTAAASDALEPSGADDTDAILEAIEKVAAAKGTVTLSEGVFTIGAELTLDGVTLAGQGYEKTTVRQTAAKRVATLLNGAKISGITVTGGRTTANWENGAGFEVKDGTVSGCRVCGNRTFGRNTFGGGIFIAKGVIEKSVVADNVANAGAGGGIGFRMGSGPVTIDGCEITGNVAKEGDGGGVAFVFGNPEVTIRDTKITGNVASRRGGGLFLDAMSKKVKLENSSVVGNKADGADADIAGTPAK